MPAPERGGASPDAQEDLPTECVINISEGRDRGLIEAVAEAGGDTLLDVHSDGEHHRSVITLAGDLPEVEVSVRRVACAALDAIDLTSHHGVHPRLGAVDVVPFVPLGGPVDRDGARGARDRFAHWMADEQGVPCFLYGTGRTLPEVRRGAFTDFPPDAGPPSPHRSAGACAVGVRDVLIAYNVWIHADPTADQQTDPVFAARALARALRRPGLRTLGIAVAGGAQVSCNVVDVERVTLTEVYDAVSEGTATFGCTIWQAELVGLLPRSALTAVPDHRWSDLGLRAEDTIEFRRDSVRG